MGDFWHSVLNDLAVSSLAQSNSLPVDWAREMSLLTQESMVCGGCGEHFTWRGKQVVTMTSVGTQTEILDQSPEANDPNQLPQITLCSKTSVAKRSLRFAQSSTPPHGRRASLPIEEACTCRKSKCLKKYCVCYKAGRACGAECRCQGCTNSYGKRPPSTDVGGSTQKRAKADIKVAVDVLRSLSAS